MKRVLASLVVVISGVIPAVAQQGKLELAPAKGDQAARQMILAAKAVELMDADAVPMYNQAARILPANIPEEKMKKWREMPASQLPLAEAEAVLKQYAATFMMLEQAISCKSCKWPAFKPGAAMTANLTYLKEYRTMAYGLALWARVAIVKQQYGEAVDVIRAGLRMAEQVGESDIMVQQLVAVAIAGVMCDEIEQLAQSPGSPNLYWAFDTLPEPLVDLEKSIAAEVSNIENYNALVRSTMLKQVKSSHDKVRALAGRLRRHVSALQCIEALRLYAAESGSLPKSLAGVTQVSVPDDPVEKKPFIYRSTGSSAVLETPIPKGGTQKDAIHYELTLKK